MTPSQERARAQGYIDGLLEKKNLGELHHPDDRAQYNAGHNDGSNIRSALVTNQRKSLRTSNMDKNLAEEFTKQEILNPS